MIKRSIHYFWPLKWCKNLNNQPNIKQQYCKPGARYFTTVEAWILTSLLLMTCRYYVKMTSQHSHKRKCGRLLPMEIKQDLRTWLEKEVMSNKLGKEQTTREMFWKPNMIDFPLKLVGTLLHRVASRWTKKLVVIFRRPRWLRFFVRRAEVAAFMTLNNVQEEQIPCGVFS